MPFPFRRAVLACSLLIVSAAHADAPVTDGARTLAALQNSGLDPELLRKGLEAVACAQDKGHPRAARLGVIDFRLPSSERRLWVLDLATGEILFHEHVAHGRGSGEALASRFSNVSESYTSSLGLFETLEPYSGANGYSLRLQGLEPGINDRAYERAIVMHGADYVGEGFIKTAGRLGRSYGCPAVRPEIARPLIDTLRGHQYLFAYAEAPNWPGTPASLGCESAAKPMQTAAQ
ncbi:MAG TPA: murein L,D-transpeptidase catalytic domain family protein [Fontimonas sp.]